MTTVVIKSISQFKKKKIVLIKLLHGLLYYLYYYAELEQKYHEYNKQINWRITQSLDFIKPVRKTKLPVNNQQIINYWYARLLEYKK